MPVLLKKICLSIVTVFFFCSIIIPHASAQKPYENFNTVGNWTLGSAFSDLQPQLKNMKIETEYYQIAYSGDVAFFDDNQYLNFHNGILEYASVYQKGKGIKNKFVVGDTVKKVVDKLGNPLTKMNTSDSIYYSYGNDYTDPELTVEIRNGKVISVQLEKITEGFPDENRAVQYYLNNNKDKISFIK
ncbi:hypothetical protein MKY98_19150 [Paenibacillus sp. FSL M8-0228]|uniref:hypothetical protein n=1 Tax=Paenibacillus sp. FSL M8-0228 TaxID=2921620 RepID=UPI0030FC0E5B